VRDGWRPKSSWGPEIRERIASQVEGIRHWKVLETDWWRAPDIEATWFVDPPYHRSGKHYKYRDIDYTALGIWCRARKGQTIVCEQDGADWLPFRQHKDAKGCTGKGGTRRTAEVVWTNEVPR
jgi:16S rRNA G966 N2-methylase RsmD